MHDVTEAINPQFILPKGIYAVPFWEYPHDGYVPQELWRVVEPWMMEHGVREDTYYVSTYGRIYSCYTGKFMAPLRNNNTGYCHISLGEKNSIAIHRLVMIAFCWVSNYKELDVDHIDCNPSNNCIWNLQWCYHQENLEYMYQRNLNNKFKFQETGESYISKKDARYIMTIIANCKNPREIEKRADEFGVTYRWLYDLRNGSIRPGIRQWYEQTYGPIPELEWKRGMGGVEKLDDETAYQMVKEMYGKPYKQKEEIAKKYGMSIITACRYLAGTARPHLKERLDRELGGGIY